MKTTAGPRCARRGFTLLELVAVMSIMVLIIALGVAAFRFYDETDPFEEPVARLSRMSRYAHHSASLQHRGQTIAFDKKGFGLWGASGGDGSYYAVPDGMKVLIRRMNSKDWEKAEGQIWQFGEQGICDPIKVRFVSADGYRDLAFHPLTGKPIDS